MSSVNKIFYGLLGVIATGGLILFFSKKEKKTEQSYSGCNGLKGNEKMDDMCHHLSSEHEQAEKEIKSILYSLKSGVHCTKDIVDVWDKELKHHFQEEENVVFPAMLKKEPSVKPIIDDLIKEHNFFYSAISEMKRLGNCDNISIMFCEKLLNHINKEENLFKNI